MKIFTDFNSKGVSFSLIWYFIGNFAGDVQFFNLFLATIFSFCWMVFSSLVLYLGECSRENFNQSAFPQVVSSLLKQETEFIEDYESKLRVSSF